MSGFNPFGFFGSTTAAQEQAVQPSLAGQNNWILDQIKRRKELLDAYGLEKGDWFGNAMAQQAINQILIEDPVNQEQKLRMYEGTMNRLADAANERAMKGHIFAGLINLPNKWQEAMAEKYRFVQPQMELAARGSSMVSPFLTRQYINI